MRNTFGTKKTHRKMNLQRNFQCEYWTIELRLTVTPSNTVRRCVRIHIAFVVVAVVVLDEKKWEDENCVDCVCEFGMSATHTHRMSYYKIYTPIANRDSTTETLTLTLTLWRNNFVECAFFFFNSFVNIYSVFKANAHFKVTAVCLINETKTKKEI